MNYRSKSLMNLKAKKDELDDTYKSTKLKTFRLSERQDTNIFYNIFVKSSRKGKIKSKVDFLCE